MDNDKSRPSSPTGDNAPNSEQGLPSQEHARSRLVTASRPPTGPAPSNSLVRSPVLGTEPRAMEQRSAPPEDLSRSTYHTSLPTRNNERSPSLLAENETGHILGSVTGVPRRRSPGDAGSVVNGTPVSLSPGPHRRELGASPVRLTPTNNPATPSPEHNLGTLSASPRTDGRDSLVLWGTTVNMQDVEQRLSAFIKGHRVAPPTIGDLDQAEKPKSSGDNHMLSTDVTDQNGERQLDTDNDVADNSTRDNCAYYMDLLHHLAETGESITNIDMSHLHEYDPGLYQKVRTYPNELITVFDAVTTSIFKELFPEEAKGIDANKRKSLQVRTYNLLPNHVQSMRDLNPSDISNLVAVRGMIIRSSCIIPDIQVAMYSCSKCRALVDVRISHGRIDEPRKCSSCNTRDSFTLIHSRSTFSDKQMVRLQEAPESIPKGETPSTFTLVMYDSLVDTVKPGDRVEVTGILRATPVRVNPKLRVVRSVFRTYIDCVHIRTLGANHSGLRTDQDFHIQCSESFQPPGRNEERAIDEKRRSQRWQELRTSYFDDLSGHPKLYDRLASSLAPSIFGMDDEKKGILLQLFGGAHKTSNSAPDDSICSDGSQKFRSSINILLVGDPGTSKSQLLHSAHRLAPRGVYTSGRGSSAVGLTAYVTRDPDSDDYVLESGALVLSDRGLCCIDEFDKMSDFARSVLHEAMEQQTVSIAKAGIIATLNARTAVLAAANPVNSRYDASKSVVDNIDLPPTLLSRFDLIYLVLDAPNGESDRRLAQHIVSLFFRNYEDSRDTRERRKNSYKIDSVADRSPHPSSAALKTAMYDSGGLFDAKTLTSYIAYAREKVNPRISEAAAEALINGYVDMRSKGRGTGSITATPRQLESLIRLAEAHARMQLKKEVDVSDVSEAVRLVRSALHMAAYNPDTGRIDMNLFSAEKARASDGRFESFRQLILNKLNEETARKEVSTSSLLSKLKETARVNITAGELREVLGKLQLSGHIVKTNGGKTVRLVGRD